MRPGASTGGGGGGGAPKHPIRASDITMLSNHLDMFPWEPGEFQKPLRSSELQLAAPSVAVPG